MNRLCRIALLFLIAAGLLLCSGCWVVSVHPLYQDREFNLADPGLVGQWWQPKGDCRLSISLLPNATSNLVPNATGPAYLLEYTGPDDSQQCAVESHDGALKFYGRLVDLQGHVFMDMLPVDRPCAFQAIKTHSIYRTRLVGDAIDLVPLGYEFVTAAIRDGKVQGLVSDDLPIITAPTAELRNFVLAHVNDDAAFPELLDDKPLWHFTRMPGDVPPRVVPETSKCNTD